MLKSSSRWLISLSTFAVLNASALCTEKDPRISDNLEALQSVIGSQVVARRFIPSEQRREGELRLIISDSVCRVQVLLYTASLGRALREMRKSERLNWPIGKVWQPHSAKYLETLDSFREHLRTGTDKGEEGGTHLYNVMIEFINGEGDPSIRLSEVTYEGTPEALRVVQEVVYDDITLSGNYVRSNQFILVQNGFELSPETTVKLLSVHE